MNALATRKTRTAAVGSSTFDMRSLLERAGFRLRGARRADCIHCEGHSRATVAFTSEVACCHRCKWAANGVTLARELRLLCGDSQTARAVREASRRRESLDAEIKPFDTWREARIREVSDRYRSLSAAAVRAEEMLRKNRDSEAAWDSLARFYHAEAQLSAAFDWLMFAKASAWLEDDSTPAEVFATWRRYVA
jgi:hypothetical protein